MLVERTRRLYETSRTLRETPWIGYGFALGAAAAALGVRLALSGVLSGFPFLTFFPAIFVTAFIFGWRAGAVCAVASGFATWRYLLVADAFTGVEADALAALRALAGG